MFQAGRSLEAVCDMVNPQSICVENLEAPPFEAVLPVVEQYGVRVCLDVGHLAHQGGGELDFLAQHADLIGEVHLHDATSTAAAGRLIVNDHMPLGQGTIDYKAFLRALDDSGYTGVVILENNSRQDLEASLEQVGNYV
jgi:sugar phosphate isomerase/epimerase